MALSGRNSTNIMSSLKDGNEGRTGLRIVSCVGRLPEALVHFYVIGFFFPLVWYDPS